MVQLRILGKECLVVIPKVDIRAVLRLVWLGVAHLGRDIVTRAAEFEAGRLEGVVRILLRALEIFHRAARRRGRAWSW